MRPVRLILPALLGLSACSTLSDAPPTVRLAVQGAERAFDFVAAMIPAPGDPADRHEAISPVRLTAIDTGRIVDLATEQKLVIDLPVQAGTGAQWDVVGTPANLDEVILGQPLGTDEPLRLGQKEHQRFAYRATIAGAGLVRLAYRRPWAGDLPPEQTFEITVRVAG